MRLSAILLGVFLATAGWATERALENAALLETRGDFKAAAELLKKALSDPQLAAGDREQLRFDLDRLDRIRKDFPLSEDALYAALEKTVRGLGREEYARWLKEGRFDTRTIDGKRLFMVSSVSNLFWRYPELNSRRIPPPNTAGLEKQHLQVCERIRAAVRKEGRPYVLPKRFEVTMEVNVKPGAVPAGQTVRAWLPIPREYPFQTGFELLSSSSPLRNIDSAQSAIRSAYLEQPAAKDGTRFSVMYTYTASGVRFEVDPAKINPHVPTTPSLQPFLSEGPHVVFTPEMRKLSQSIAGNETNPYLKARKFNEWISENIKYSYAIEYSTIRNISEYCRSRGYGDCGQEALLFITLCRLNGIPARWQSGWSTFPNSKSIHDWAEIYLEPYGWMPVDPYMGIFAMRYANSLTADEKRELRDFYFCGLDQYRMIANSDHNQRLTPEKRTLRSDTVDFQRGELEAGDQNLYFDKYSYDLSIREVPPTPVTE